MLPGWHVDRFDAKQHIFGLEPFNWHCSDVTYDAVAMDWSKADSCLAYVDKEGSIFHYQGQLQPGSLCVSPFTYS